MTDILARLLEFHAATMRISGPGESGTMIMIREAADEIDRLSRQTEELRDQIERLRAGRAADQQRLFHLEGTIERLTAERDDALRAASDLSEGLQRACAEPCVYESRPRSPFAQGIAQAQQYGAWCRTHGWDCPNSFKGI